jgi:two-component system cell cycle sensor histidine kinase/response regulator CckA
VHWQLNPYAGFMMVTALASAILAIHIWQRRPAQAATTGALLMLAISVWSLGYALELGSQRLAAKLFWSNVNIAGFASVPVLWFVFVVQFTHRDRWLTRRNLTVLALPSLITLALTWTNQIHGLIRTVVGLDSSGLLPVLDQTYGLVFWVFWIYTSLLMMAASAVMLCAIATSPRMYQGQFTTLLLGALVPWAGSLMYVLDLTPFPGLDLTPFSFGIAGLMVAWGLFRHGLFAIVPVARDLIIESMDDGVVVFDAQDCIVNVNPAAARLLGRPPAEIIGQPSDQALSAWPGVFERFRDITEARAEITLAVDGELRQYDMRVSPLYGRQGQLTGRLFVARNIDDRKRIEKTLQQEKETFYSILQKAPYGVLLMDQDEQCLYVNPEFTKITGLTLGDVPTVEDWFRQAFPDAAYRQEVIERWTSDTTQRLSRVFRVACPGTGIKEVEFRPMLLGDGRAILVLSDITERRKAEEERERLLAQIQAQVQRVQQIIDTVPEGVFLLDGDRQVVVVNPAAETHLLVLSGASESGARVGDVLTHLGNRSLAEILAPPPQGLWHEVRTDGRNFQVIARPMSEGAGASAAPEAKAGEVGLTTSGWVLVTRDVTQQREIEQRTQQQERLAAVGQLAAGIAHDFNNIMSTIVLYAEMVGRSDALPIREQERMATVTEQARHATRLIQQILDFSRRAVLERRPLDLVPLLREHVELLERTLPENIKVEMVYELGQDGAPLTVNADPTRFLQAITNLAVNAREAMPEQGGTLRIDLKRLRIEAEETPPLPEIAAGEWVRIVVSDTGSGIPPDVLPHIFEPFFTTRAPMGSGLGLAQVHGIVAQHDGAIGVESKLGQGTVFTIYLPALPQPELEQTSKPTEQGHPLTQGHGEMILVAEDDDVVRGVLAESLEMLNYGVLEAADGAEALALLEQRGHEIEMLLSDVVMPEMGGIALLRALRERGLTLPVVLLTGHLLERELEDLRTRWEIDWLPKPCSLERLAEVINRRLAKTER